MPCGKMPCERVATRAHAILSCVARGEDRKSDRFDVLPVLRNADTVVPERAMLSPASRSIRYRKSRRRGARTPLFSRSGVLLFILMRIVHAAQCALWCDPL